MFVKGKRRRTWKCLVNILYNITSNYCEDSFIYGSCEGERVLRILSGMMLETIKISMKVAACRS